MNVVMCLHYAKPEPHVNASRLYRRKALQADLASAEATDTIEDGNESLQLRDFVGADRDQRLARAGRIW